MRINRTELGFAAFAVVSGVLCLWLGGLEAVERAFGSAGRTILMILPLFAAGLLLAGLVHVLVPRAAVARWLGAASGVRGLAIAMGVGAVTPGGPFTSFPLVVALAEAGADIGVLVAYLTSWATLGIHRILIWEIPLLGADFVALRVLASLPLAVLAGLLARAIALRLAARRGSD
ncbi:MAG: permease [Burkholderiales bacterium]|nr:permease [Burkholderiales bacterium]